ncbi:putative integral membrane sensor protein [Catenulispora acidiphila DSM 44928]|uniref:Putative integral membrane sensor protein n=1 Tax=Catenulispora acidiphila (strain DSM 44928 / JCM 14897 / NBRC 102108 / NRRL B-24433 / ID139908) TaxID=479433 RepID=C7QB69_CATAD|nr:MHYT domain-containing protein [Catenulispora acidiphila]ACU76360.1 putative integral membrane sensor protein [Catenulispora acidiphila DSM 44928]
MHVNGFTYGPLTPLLAFFMSFLGSMIGLQSASRARAAEGASRTRWLAMASVALGGTAIWVMQYIAILGFTVPGVEIRFDPVLTVGSLVAAIAVVALGLTVVVRRQADTRSLWLSGLVIGTGIAGVNCLGLVALHMAPGKHYTVWLIAASEAVAVAGSAAALWCALRVRGLASTVGAAVVLGAAVTGAHYLGIAALHLTGPAATDPSSLTTAPVAPAGMAASALLTPLVLGISIVTTVMLLVVAMAPTERELHEERRAVELAAALRERSY